jgi:arylsulfatase A-like enzyme
MLIDGGGRKEAFDKVEYYKKLKEEGVFIEKLITYAPYSIGCLNALFSGMNGNVNGVEGYYKSYSFDKDHIFTLAQYLKESGYRTELDFVIEDVLPQQGFDRVRTFGKDDTKEINLTERHSEILTQLKNKQPFFVFLDYNKIALHLSRNVIKKYDDFSEEFFRNKEKNLSNYTSWLEESAMYVEKILSKLKELGLYDDSIIIIFTDHGESMGDKKGEKVHGVFLYDYTIRCWAYLIGKQFPGNKAISQMVRHIDIMPTLLDILCIEQKKNFKPMLGKSLIPFLDGQHESLIAYSETGGLGGPTPSPEIHNVQSVRTDKWKLIYNKTNKKKELYNLEEDPAEENNLAGKGNKSEQELMDELKSIELQHEEINKKFKK